MLQVYCVACKKKGAKNDLSNYKFASKNTMDNCKLQDRFHKNVKFSVNTLEIEDKRPTLFYFKFCKIVFPKLWQPSIIQSMQAQMQASSPKPPKPT